MGKTGSKKPRGRTWLVIAAAVLLLYVVQRFFVLEAFKIPSETMVPTLVVGDHIFVNKAAYGLFNPFTRRIWVRFDDPAYGDVVVFVKPSLAEQGAAGPGPMPEFYEQSEMTGEDFIKRVVALGGDTVEMRDDVLHINGHAVPRCRIGGSTFESYNRIRDEWEGRSAELWLESNRGVVYTVIEERDGPSSSFGPILVPEGQAFVLGDNRDNSNDSRYWGSVPYDNIVGRANLIWCSDQPQEGLNSERIGRDVMDEPELTAEQAAASADCPRIRLRE